MAEKDGPKITDDEFAWGPKQEEDPPAGVREPRRPRPTRPTMGAALDPPPVLVGATED